MTFAFTEAEHRARIERARQTLAENRLYGAICVAPEHIFYFGHLGEPSARFRSLYAAAQESQQALVDGVKPGEPIGHVAAAGADVLDRHGLSQHMYVRWGYGVGIGYPPAWLEPLDVVPDSMQVWQPGMVFCLHVELNLLTEGLGLIVGGDYLLHPDGIEALDTAGGGPEKRPLVVV